MGFHSPLIRPGYFLGGGGTGGVPSIPIMRVLFSQKSFAEKKGGTLPSRSPSRSFMSELCPELSWLGLKKKKNGPQNVSIQRTCVK